MIGDLRSEPLGEQVEAEYCVVGAGAAGVTLARKLSEAGRSVLLLEGGGLAEEAEAQALFSGDSIGHPIDLEAGRIRRLGGATTAWTGRCIALDPIDFEPRDWVAHSGWPIGLEDVSRYYPAAARECGFADAWLDEAAVLEQLGVNPPAMGADDMTLAIWRYAPQFGRRRYRDWGADNLEALRRSDRLRVLLNANVVDFGFEEGGRLTHVEAASLNGKRIKARAQTFVLCCGGGENARLLLHARETGPGCVRDGAAMAGRFFMQHPRGSIGRVIATAAQAARLQDLFNVFARRTATQYEVGLALSPALQRRARLLNASVILTYEADPQSAWERLKRGARARNARGLADLVGALSNPAELGRNLWRRGVKGRHPLLAARAIDAIIDLEQEPDPESRLFLGTERDALGMRRLTADWRIGALETRTSRAFADVLERELPRMGLGRLERAAWLAEPGPPPTEALAGTYHHIATTRMSSSARDGVVDAKCRVHGTHNLYVQGCSVFATGGHANPTLSIVALALRQADIFLKSPPG